MNENYSAGMGQQKFVQVQRQKSFEWSKLISDNTFTIKSLEKTGIFQISMLYDDPFPRYELFVFNLDEVLLAHTSRVILIHL